MFLNRLTWSFAAQLYNVNFGPSCIYLFSFFCGLVLLSLVGVFLNKTFKIQSRILFYSICQKKLDDVIIHSNHLFNKHMLYSKIGLTYVLYGFVDNIY
jgi:hypothetical protein